MLFLNKETEVSTREFKFGTINGIALGEHGRGRQQKKSGQEFQHFPVPAGK